MYWKILNHNFSILSFLYQFLIFSILFQFDKYRFWNFQKKIDSINFNFDIDPIFNLDHAWVQPFLTFVQAYIIVLTPTEMVATSAVAVTYGAKITFVLFYIMPVFVTLSSFGTVNSNIMSSSRFGFNSLALLLN